MTDKQLITGFEMTVPRCALTYGSSPCTATIGITGLYKCYNTPATCQATHNYVEEWKLLRWVDSNDYVDLDGTIIPSLVDVRVMPMTIRPAEDIGERETATMSFSNHKDPDTILDKYRADRVYHPYDYGDFWSRFDARYPNIQGYECSILRGYAGQSWSSFERSRYIVDKGILAADGSGYVITARDVFMLLQNNKSQIPLPCDGFLDGNITTASTSFTLEPAGIGSFVFPNGKPMYPTSGFAYIGQEYFQYTRSGDVITMVSRALRGSVLEEHKEGDAMQVVEFFNSMTSSQILQRILSFTEIPTYWNDVPAWNTEVSSYDSRLYSGHISDPTQVSKILSELIRDICLTIYPDVVSTKIVMEYMRNRPVTYTFNDGNTFDGTRSKDYDKRVSSVYLRFGRNNPLKKMDENTNYLGRIYRLDSNANNALQKNSDVVYDQYSRFIPLTLRPAADDVTKMRLGRYSKPPRIWKFSVDQKDTPRLGKFLNATTRLLVDPRGWSVPVVMQVTSVARAQGVSHVTAEEFAFEYQPTVDDHIITISADLFCVNLRALHDSLYSSVTSTSIVKFYIDSGIKVGDNRTGVTAYAMFSGNWPAGCQVHVYLSDSTSRIQGRGGQGGQTSWTSGLDGEPGGNAIWAIYPITVHGNGKIWGGGGGEGASTYEFEFPSSGGGGAGYLPGDGASIDFGSGGGGNPGMDGASGTAENISAPTPGSGGLAGKAVLNAYNVTFTDSPDIRGPLA